MAAPDTGADTGAAVQSLFVRLVEAGLMNDLFLGSFSNSCPHYH